ncbi:MAG: hypothetical protein ACXW61_09090, partial [Gemmatirosa sp.]
MPDVTSPPSPQYTADEGTRVTDRATAARLDGPRRARPRVCVVAPSLRILGGQAIQADRLMRHLRADGRVDVGFIPHNPKLPAPL